jgi:type IV pilus assembly protein PilQ
VIATALMAPLAASGGRDNAATLRKIASQVNDRAGVISIEASDPVAYVASQPEPRTLLLELRDVVAAGFVDQFTPDSRSPITSVQVDSAHAVDGVDVARVRVTLSQPMRPRVRSARNVIYVEADRPERGVTADSGMISLSGPSSAIRDLRVARRGEATAVTLIGTGPLVASNVQEAVDGTRRLVIDLPNVTSALKSSTPVNQGPVERVRTVLHPRSALITQVVMDLSRPSTYRVESSSNGSDLTVVFDEPVADPIDALRGPVSARAAVAPVTPRAIVAPEPAVAPALRPAAPLHARQDAPSIEPSLSSKYTGHPVSLDFQGADLRAVLRTFAEISGLNIVIDPTIVGSVDVALRDVPWDQALDIILRANKLGYGIDGTIVRVAPLNVLSEEESRRRELQDFTRAHSYAKPDDQTKLLETSVLSSRGTNQMHARTHMLIIND